MTDRLPIGNHLALLPKFGHAGLLCAALLAFAEPRPARAVDPELKFKFLGRDQGLHSGAVYCMFKDKQGFLWLGTRFGLKRYDGYTFKSYDDLHGDRSNSLGGPIAAICEDNSGTLWVAPIGGGLVALDRKTNGIRYYQHYSTEEGISEGSIISLGVDNFGALWAISERWVMNRFDSARQQFTSFKPPVLLVTPGRISVKMLPLVGDKYYLSTWGTTLTFDTRTYEYKRISDGYLNGNFLAWLIPLAGDTALAFPRSIVPNRPLYLLDLSTGKRSKQYDLRSAYPFTAATIHNGRTAYLLSERRGLISLDLRTGKWRAIPIDGLMYPFSIVIDKNENLWIGAAEGVYVSNGLKQAFQGHTLRKMAGSKDVLTRTPVRALHAYGSMLEAGTELGRIFTFDHSSRHFQFSYQLNSGVQGAHSPLHHINCDDRDNTYYATTNGPLYIKQGQRDASLFQGLYANFGYSVLVDNRQFLWLGLNRLDDRGVVPHAVVRFDPERRSRRFYKLALPGRENAEANHTFSLYQDRRGVLWAGSSSGLYQYLAEQDTFVARFHPRSDGSAQGPNNIWVIFEDSRGWLWLGSWGRGLHRYDPATQTYTDFSVEHGLPSNNIQSILEDESGHLWIATSKGLSRLQVRGLSFTNFGLDDGLLDEEFQPKAAAKLPSGEMFFGGLNGITSFHPSAVTKHSSQPPLVFTDFRIGGFGLGDVRGGDTLTMSHNNSDIIFDFGTLDFGAADRKRYAYTIEGLDDDWVLTPARNSGAYNNLPPGKYVLRVRATNTHGDWLHKELRLHLHVLPPFWHTWWFRSAIASLVLAAGLVIVRRRRQRTRDQELRLDAAREHERLELAGDIHDGPLQDLYAARFLVADDVQIGELLANVRADLRSISSVLQPPKLQSGLIEELGILVQAFRQRRPDTSFELIANGPQCQLPESVGRNIFRIARTALTNVQKHSKASSCVITATFEPNGIDVSIEDDGVGFDPGRIERLSREHFGLFLMRCYAKEIKATISVESVEGRGTALRIRWRGKRFSINTMRSLRIDRKQHNT